MAVTQNSYTGNGSTTNYSFTFPYLKTADVKCSIDATETTAFTLANATTIQFNSAPANGAKIKIFRKTDDSDLTATFYAGSAIKSSDLNDNFTQNLYTTQEVNARYLSNLGGTMLGDLAMGEDHDIIFEGATDNANETKLTVADPTADRTITLPDVTGTVVTTGDSGTVTSTMISDGTIVNADINASAAIAQSKLNIADATTSASGYQSAADKTKLDGIETGATADQNAAEIRYLVGNASDSNVFTDADHTKLDGIETAATADQTDAEIRAAVGNANDSNVLTDALKNKLDGIETSATADQTASEIKSLIASSPLDASHLAPNSVTTSEIADAELTTLAGMQSATASKLADSTALTSDIADLNQIDGLTKQTTISDSDASFPTSGAVVDYVAAQIAPLGGLEVIATEVAFPNTQPSSGVVISISDAGGVVFNGSGTSTTGRTVNGSTVTINNAPSSLNSETLAAGVGLMVSSTGSGQVYNYHKILGKEEDIKQLSDDINDFAARYRVGSSNPTSSLDSGDLFFNTSTGKLLVYNGTNSAWEEAQSIGNFYISTFSESFDGSRTAFTVSNAPTYAQQLLISINGVIQKPNSGTGQPSEGFTLSGSTVTFSAPIPSGSIYFAVVIGSTVNIGTPSDNTVSTAILQNGSITNAKVNASAAIDATKLSFTQSGTGAQARTVDSKLKDVVNVADFGATGDGTTNDTTAIQNAINSLNNGGVVEFNVGTFLIDQTLNLTKKIHLVGKGGYFLNQFYDDQFTVGGTTIKLKNSSNTDMLKVQLDNASTGEDYRSHCSIRNIHFFGNRSDKQNPTDNTSNNNNSGNGIVISGVRYVTLENVIVTKCADDGLKLQSHTYSSGTASTNNIDIRACAFHSNGQNGATLAGGDSIMDSCTLGYNANSGITVTGFGIISNSLVWDNFDNGIFVQGSLENVTIVGNKIYDNDHVGIYLNDTNFNKTIPTSAIATSTNVITSTNHGLVVNDQLKYTSNGTNITKASSTDIADGTILFVKTVPSGNTFTLSETAGGAELDLDGAGNDNQTFTQVNITKTATASITGNKIVRNGGKSSSANLGGESSGIFINTVATNELIINGNEIGNSDDLWDTSKSYTTGNRVRHGGRLYVATGAVNSGQTEPAPDWSSSTTYSTNTYVQAFNKIYKATTTINSGGTEPSHTSGTTNNWLFVANTNWDDKGTVQDYGIYFNKTETIVRGFAGNDITRNDTSNIYTQPNTQPIVYEFGSATFDTEGNLTTTKEIKIENTQPGLRFNDTGANPDFIIQNRDGSFAVRDTTNNANRFLVNMADGAITGTGDATFSKNIILEGGSGHSYPHVEFHSSAANVRKWRILAGQSWNPDALLIYDIDEDSTAVTIETNKLGVNRGASSLTEAFEVGGNASITGNLILATSGKGIDFSAVSDGSRSVSSNLLDDYEEGTFTPTLGWSLTPTTANGRYTKIGRMVYYALQMVWPTTTNLNYVLIGGLPFDAMDGANAGGAFIRYTNYSSGGDIKWHQNNDQSLTAYHVNGTSITNSVLSTLRMDLVGFYIV